MTAALPARADAPTDLPRLGFLGVGWIGRNRMRAIAAAGVADVAAIADPVCGQEALADAPGAKLADGLEALLASDLDGIVIATPSALHASQAIAALRAGMPVFCQKPLGRTAAETRAVVDAAREADRLLGVDLSYRHTAAAQAVRAHAGTLGELQSVDLVFHNAYGPDKPWFLDPELSGGGCVIDLGVHLVDLLLWTLDFPAVLDVHARMWSRGEVEDHCLAQLELEGGVVARLACSWFSHEGRDAVIEATFRGTDAAVGFHNVGGSFYDFVAERREGTTRSRLASPPDDWGGRAAIEWARRLRTAPAFDPAAEQFVAVAETLDRIYGR